MGGATKLILLDMKGGVYSEDGSKQTQAKSIMVMQRTVSANSSYNQSFCSSILLSTTTHLTWYHFKQLYCTASSSRRQTLVIGTTIVWSISCFLFWCFVMGKGRGVFFSRHLMGCPRIFCWKQCKVGVGSWFLRMAVINASANNPQTDPSNCFCTFIV